MLVVAFAISNVALSFGNVGVNMEEPYERAAAVLSDAKEGYGCQDNS